MEQYKFGKYYCWFLSSIWHTIIVQSFIVLASLVLELVGGSQWPPLGTNVANKSLGL